MLALRIRLSASAGRPAAFRGLSTPRSFSSIPLRPANGISTPRTPSLLNRTARPAWTASPLRSSIAASLPRFNSTSSSTPAANEAAAAAGSPVAPSADVAKDLAEVYPEYISKNLDLGAFDMSQYTERSLGFVKQLGLDFGWGPTGLAEWIIEHVHVFGGLPWWGTIVATSVIVRTLMFYPSLKMADTTAKTREIQPIMMPLMMKQRERAMAGDQAGMNKYRMEVQELNKVAGISKIWMATPFIQLPVLYGLFNCLREMGAHPVPGFLTGGFGWVTNLTLADPFYLLPLVTSSLMSLQFAWGGDTGSMGMNMSPKMKAFMVFGLPAVSFLFFMNFPAAISFYFLCNTILALIQNRIFRNEPLRAAMGIYPLNPPETEKPILSRVRKAKTVEINELPKESTGYPFLDKILGTKKETATPLMGVNQMKKSYDQKNKTRVYDKYEQNRLKKKAEERERALNEMRLRQEEFRLQSGKKEEGEKTQL